MEMIVKICRMYFRDNLSQHEITRRTGLALFIIGALSLAAWTSLMARVKELEDENKRLKKLYIEAQMQADIIKEAIII